MLKHTFNDSIHKKNCINEFVYEATYSVSILIRNSRMLRNLCAIPNVVNRDEFRDWFVLGFVIF